MSRVLVVTADDLGYCGERNRGILAAFQSGVVTRSSLLVNASCPKEAAALAAEHKIPFGLHLNLTEGRSISPKNKVRSLLTKDQFFKGKNGFRDCLAEGAIDLEEVRIEIRAQIRLFNDLTGYFPTFVDGHQHVHILAGIRDVFAEVLEESGVHSTRLPIEHGIEDCGWIPTSRRDFYVSVVNDAKRACFVFRKHGIRFSDGFVGMATMGRDMSRERLEAALHTAFMKQSSSSSFSSSSSPASNAGAGKPMLNCDMHTVNSTTITTTTTTTTCPQPGAVDACGSGAVSARTAPGSCGWGDEMGENGEAESSGAPDLNRRTAHLCDMASSKDPGTDVRILLPLLPPSAQNGVEVELMVHPGYPCVDGDGGCGEGPDDFARSSDRLHELNVLTNPWFKAFLAANSIQLRHDLVGGRLQL